MPPNPKAPSYHINKACEGLHQPFRDFELPVGFVEIYGEAGVIRFRKWLNFDVLEHDPERFKIKCEALWPQVSWHSVLLERKENSGVHVLIILPRKRSWLHQLFDGAIYPMAE